MKRGPARCTSSPGYFPQPKPVVMAQGQIVHCHSMGVLNPTPSSELPTPSCLALAAYSQKAHAWPVSPWQNTDLSRHARLSGTIRLKSSLLPQSMFRSGHGCAWRKLRRDDAPICCNPVSGYNAPLLDDKLPGIQFLLSVSSGGTWISRCCSEGT